jgi:IS30 family transposase
MAPPLSQEQTDLLKKLYYEDKFLVGVDKLYEVTKAYPKHPSRRQVRDWLKAQKLYQLHLRPKRTTTIKPVLGKQPGVLFQLDLIDMGKYEEAGFRYISVLIDAFSREMYAVPLKNKDGETVASAFEKTYNDNELYKMRVLQSDNGAEFKNDLDAFLQGRNIQHITGIAGRPQSQGIVERSNQTIKALIFKNMTLNKNKKWKDDLDELVGVYNETFHTTIGRDPIEVNVKNEKEVATAISNNAIASNRQDPNDLKVGDQVRLKKFKGVLDKQTTQNWTRKVYTITKVIPSRSPFIRIRYTLKHPDGDIVKNNYGRNDLQKIIDIQKPPRADDEEEVPDEGPTTRSANAPPRPPAAPRPPRRKALNSRKNQAIAKRTSGPGATNERKYKMVSLYDLLGVDKPKKT